MQEEYILCCDTHIIDLCICNSLVVKIKRNYPLRKVSEARQNVKLTFFQIDVLVGVLLGDASLERRKSSHNTRLRFDQTFPTHASYLIMLYGTYYNLTSSSPSMNIRNPDKRTGKIYRSLSFKTVSLPCLNE